MRSAIILAATLLTAHAFAEAPDTVFLDELTWTEVRDAIADGTTTIIVATAGTEQNGPHMALGKHKFIIEHTSELIARRLGKTLVAPVIAYVPEGGHDPPTGSMRYPGTISIPNTYFMKLLEYTARSFEVHGFTDIVFIGDSGGNQRGMEEVASALSEEWRGGETRVHFVGEYYYSYRTQFREWLEAQGEPPDAIGTHAGITDTSQVLAIAPQHIRLDKRAPGGGFEGSGVTGDPSRANAEYGKKAIEIKVENTVARVRELLAGR